MNLTTVLPALLRELVDGTSDPATSPAMLNRGDPGLLASLDRLSAQAASTTDTGGASIAAHVDHLRYGLSVLNRWGRGERVRRSELDWTASWKRTTVTETEWRALRAELRREAAEWGAALATPREMNEVEAGFTIGSIAHLAYHLGAIRQIDRAARGPNADEDARAEASLRRG
jgi:hypothetical protein